MADRWNQLAAGDHRDRAGHRHPARAVALSLARGERRGAAPAVRRDRAGDAADRPRRRRLSSYRAAPSSRCSSLAARSASKDAMTGTVVEHAGDRPARLCAHQGADAQFLRTGFWTRAPRFTAVFISLAVTVGLNIALVPPTACSALAWPPGSIRRERRMLLYVILVKRGLLPPAARIAGRIVRIFVAALAMGVAVVRADGSAGRGSVAPRCNGWRDRGGDIDGAAVYGIAAILLGVLDHRCDRPVDAPARPRPDREPRIACASFPASSPPANPISAITWVRSSIT